ncbi:MAG: helix-turn-helix domain-containing protein [Tagaea sp.]|nr:helix-turn-helix domain-containing protein [Tagaea sp.]
MARRRHKRDPAKPPHRYDLVTTRLHQVYFAMVPPSQEVQAIVAGYRRSVETLRAERQRQSLTQEQLDERLGLTRGHVEKLENRTRIARGDTLMLWADGLGFEFALTPKSATRPE